MAAASPYDPTDPRQLTAGRRSELLAALLAAGVCRLLALRPTTPDSSYPPPGRLPPDSAQNSLDDPPQ